MLSEEEVEILDCWLAYRGDGMGRGPLPFGGGRAEQPAALMAALEHCFAVEARIRKADREAKRE